MLTQKLIRKQDYLATVDREHERLRDAAAQAADDKAAAATQASDWPIHVLVDAALHVQHTFVIQRLCIAQSHTAQMLPFMFSVL